MKKTIDLTHKLAPEIATWDGTCGYQIRSTDTCEVSEDQTQFHFYCLQMRAGIGTHMDAPCHCFKNASTIADIPVNNLVAPLVVLDVSEKAHADYLISPYDVQEFEKKHGKIPSNCIVIAYTGWSKYWDTPHLYRNADAEGKVHFPSLHPDTSELLLERDILGLAIDTLSSDLGFNSKFPTHELFLGAGKYLIENVANAAHLPAVGAQGAALPIKVEASEAPIRFIAIL